MPTTALNGLFPKAGRILLTGSGQEFIERIGVDAAKQVVLGVLRGENIRKQTEPLTRRRIAQLSGAMVALFASGMKQERYFTRQLSDLALRQLETAKKSDRASMWPAQWLIGLTGKSEQNVLRGDPQERQAYILEFEAAVKEAAQHLLKDIGDLRMTLGFVEDPGGKRTELSWEEITRLTTAIGSLTLTIRGSDKSTYGKLFERLVLGSVLTILGFQRVDQKTNTRTNKVFWLSDSSDVRECDATVLVRPGQMVRFDIGFIGPGNSEISKDKLTRYANEKRLAGKAYASQTFIVVDRLPETSKTKKAAEKIGAEIVQMSMQYWPRDLAQRLSRRIGYNHKLCNMSDDEIESYFRSEIAQIPIKDYLAGVSVETSETGTKLLLPD